MAFNQQCISILTFFLLITIADFFLRPVFGTREEEERQKVYEKFDEATKYRKEMRDAKFEADRLNYKAKEAEAIAEAYREMADEIKKKERNLELKAQGAEQKRKDWDQRSVKGQFFYNKLFQKCMEMTGDFRGTYLQQCMSHFLLRIIGTDDCQKYQKISKKHGYRARHCYYELRHAYTKCLGRDHRHFDFQWCVRNTGHFPFFSIPVESFEIENYQFVTERQNRKDDF